MEVEVRRVGKQDCFASLPSTLLEAFLSDQLPSFPLVLELRVPGKKGRGGPWFVAWDGSASRSSHVEVSTLQYSTPQNKFHSNFFHVCAFVSLVEFFQKLAILALQLIVIDLLLRVHCTPWT